MLRIKDDESFFKKDEKITKRKTNKMCADHSPEKKIDYTYLLFLLAILLAVAAGLSDFEILHKIAAMISTIFVRIFQCISIPIIALSLIVTLSRYDSTGEMKAIWQKTIFYTVLTTMIAALVSMALYLIIAPENIATTNAVAPTTSSGDSYLSHLSNLIPENIFAPFIDHQVIGALLVSIAIGVAIRFIPENEARIAVTNFFKGAHGIFLVMTSWIVKIIPIALFGFITSIVIDMKNGTNIEGLGSYLLVIVLSNLFQGFVILPALLYKNKIAPFSTMRKMMPALTTAFFSKSSTGTLPITIKTAENNLGINPKVSRFVLPLCTSINMNGCAAFIFTTVIYLMQNNGADISIATMFLWILISTIAALGNAGIPMGCFFLSASLLTSMNVPITLLGLILPFYSIIDMVETSLNVWSDSSVAKIIDEQIKEKKYE